MKINELEQALESGVVDNITIRYTNDYRPNGKQMAQNGCGQDETGSVRIYSWKSWETKILEIGIKYDIQNAKISQYNGKLQLDVTGADIKMAEEQ